ncbi:MULTISPECIES: enoyl-CoA hydratase-related protein [Pontibacillus]|uniref:Enoyl-CoA hydratase-related protein n=1 Tax=Pontibacillus chungwhensis TaxID=265426 RepID=A0ABY8UU55_9BACI|nr:MULTISPECIES: enoyl-CoA hydratase-related protein [Pontibacillus]MCD5323471.1 enoyl-CoA hydratase-related protein [Pontibacillus sp. HN14]WIF96848.1 enoyl-CoA hydratase-related protein [Pontibacillus chungwhensis]
MSGIKCEIKDHIAYVTLARPDALNCFNFAMLHQLGEVVESLHVDPKARVIIFTGEGEKAFSAGADLKERRTLTEAEVRRNVKKIGDVFQSIADLPQPTIAAINGYAFGGGFELMLACDFRYAVADTKMGLTETSWGIIPGAGGTQRLPRLIGDMKAKELILTAKKLTSQEAYEYGLLMEVVEREHLIGRCERLASLLLSNGPVAVQQAKYAINKGAEVDLGTGLAIESKAYEITIPTSDRLEALEAFRDKRAPHFTGK